MLFDDRLATVLRSSATGERARRTQLRQLLDLVGTASADATSPALESAFERIGELSRAIPARERADMIRDPGIRLANPRLVMVLADQEAAVASAAMASARLGSAEWLDLIPRLPVRARGLLRHRRDLGDGPDRLLASLGVRDLVLSPPDAIMLDVLSGPDEEALILEVEVEARVGPREEQEAIGAIVQRIEAFRRARENVAARSPTSPDAPRLPLGEQADAEPRTLARAFDFETDPEGRIVWADPAVAPMAVGMALLVRMPDTPARLDPATAEAMRLKQPVTAGTLILEGAPAIAGTWQIDAIPVFSVPDGHYLGHCGRLRRMPEPVAPSDENREAGDRMRQVLHELRTPVNAIQGFAEVIQQQVFGMAPHEYRALAAAIAGDAARILAGFDELDRLARLESGEVELESGHCDFAATLRATVERLQPVLESRSSGFALWGDDEAAPVPLAQADADRLAWRILATLAASITPGEHIDIHLAREQGRAVFAFELPASFAALDDLFAAAPRGTAQALSAGPFGAGFTFRLARAEARAAGGGLSREKDTLQLWLPLLTGGDATHSEDSGNAEGDGNASTRTGAPGVGKSPDGINNRSAG